jgi:hypothetical protein
MNLFRQSECLSELKKTFRQTGIHSEKSEFIQEKYGVAGVTSWSAKIK